MASYLLLSSRRYRGSSQPSPNSSSQRTQQLVSAPQTICALHARSLLSSDWLVSDLCFPFSFCYAFSYDFFMLCLLLCFMLYALSFVLLHVALCFAFSLLYALPLLCLALFGLCFAFALLYALPFCLRCLCFAFALFLLCLWFALLYAFPFVLLLLMLCFMLCLCFALCFHQVVAHRTQGNYLGLHLMFLCFQDFCTLISVNYSLPLCWWRVNETLWCVDGVCLRPLGWLSSIWMNEWMRSILCQGVSISSIIRSWALGLSCSLPERLAGRLINSDKTNFGYSMSVLLLVDVLLILTESISTFLYFCERTVNLDRANFSFPILQLYPWRHTIAVVNFSCFLSCYTRHSIVAFHGTSLSPTLAPKSIRRRIWYHSTLVPQGSILFHQGTSKASKAVAYQLVFQRFLSMAFYSIGLPSALARQRHQEQRRRFQWY